MDRSLNLYLKERAEWISSHLLSLLPDNTPHKLLQSMRYSLQSGGKRIRPILLITVLESLGKPKEIGLELACAIEMIHTYSLIHDDLPAMDNDDFRRGQPTNHKVFGEATAILAGDGLLTWAFHLAASACKPSSQISADKILHLIRELSAAAGPAGMVGGQALDIEGEGKQLSLDELQNIHMRKTGDLIHFSVYAGAILGEATETQLDSFRIYARNIGLAFQIQDDILNVIGEVEKLGKPVGSDQKLNKSTYPALMGLEAAKMKVVELIEEAKQSINIPGINPERLLQIADYMVQRDY